jgi:hypothetical protein
MKAKEGYYYKEDINVMRFVWFFLGFVFAVLIFFVSGYLLGIEMFR